MILSEKEFKALLAKNPNLKIRLGETHSEAQPQIDLSSNSKYWNIKVYVFQDGFVSETKTVDGHGKIVDHFDSRREYVRYLHLVAMEQNGIISNLSRQTSLEIAPAFNYRGEHIRAISYKADFTYMQDSEFVVEDVKGFDRKRNKSLSTSDFKLKWKLLKLKYPEYRFQIF